MRTRDAICPRCEAPAGRPCRKPSGEATLDHRERKTVHLLHVVLECGCKMARRDHPMSSLMKFPCPSGLGHGYQLHWVSVKYPDGLVHVNPAYPEKEQNR